MIRSDLRLSWRMLRREWKSGELRLVALAIIVSVAAITSVGFFTDRIKSGMEQNAAELLAADMVIQSGSSIDRLWRQQAIAYGLRVAETITFPSVVFAGDNPVLVEIKAVDNQYPLRGQIRFSGQPGALSRASEAGPTPGRLWIDKQLQRALPAGTQQLGIGQRKFAVEEILESEPDRGGNLFSIAPRAMLNITDLPSTGLIQPGSRASYQLLVAGDIAALARYRAWLNPRIENRARVLTVRDGRPELRFALQRGDQFLGLSALISVILAGAAIAVASRRFVQRKLDHSAIMRCFGASRATVNRIHGFQVLWLALGASGVGIALGFAAQWLAVELIGEISGKTLPGPTIRPALIGLATGVICLIGFAMPSLVRLGQVSPARVLRRQLTDFTLPTAGLYVSAVFAVLALMWLLTRDLRLTLYAFGGTAVTLFSLAMVAALLIQLLNRYRHRFGITWKYGIANIARRRAASTLQLLAFGTGIMVILLLTIIRTELISTWQSTIGRETPNYFAINIHPHQLESVSTLFRESGMTVPQLVPMVRARLARINGANVNPDDYQSERSRRLLTRDFNLSWAGTLQDDNKIVAGQWWTEQDHRKSLLSVEKGLAEALQLKLGDQLEFEVAGLPLTTTITSLREVDWNSFRTNFFVLMPPGTLDQYPSNYITSFHLPANESGFLATMVRAHPNITIVDIRAITEKVRNIMDQVSRAIEYVFLFSLVAGVLVLLAAIQSTLDERLVEGALMRTLGASRRDILSALLAEFSLLGSLAGLTGACGAMAIGQLIASQVLELSFQPSLWPPAIGLVFGGLGIGIAGLLGSRRIVQQPPMLLIRTV